jgi:hypothetical protein
MYYACTFDKWSGQLITADPCDTYAEAEQFIREVLSDLWYSEEARIITEKEYRKAKEAF